jgi:hypothetical protein
MATHNWQVSINANGAEKTEYVYVELPGAYLWQIERIIQDPRFGFASREAFLLDAIRQHIIKYDLQ